MMKKRRYDVLTILSRVYDLCVSRYPLSKSKNREIGDIHRSDFLNCESMCDLIKVTPSIYDRKTAARHFDIIHDIL